MINIKKRTVAILMALVMLMGLLPTVVLAEGGGNPGSNGSSWQIGNYRTEYNDSNNTVTGEEPSKSTPSNGDPVTMWKTISPTDTENLFNIDLKVQTSEEIEEIPASAAVTLVIDISASMQWDAAGGGYCWNEACTKHNRTDYIEDADIRHGSGENQQRPGQCNNYPDGYTSNKGDGDCIFAGAPSDGNKWAGSRLEDVVHALVGTSTQTGFLDTFADGGDGSTAKRMVRVVFFKNNATAYDAINWQDVSTPDGMSTVKNALNDLISSKTGINTKDKPTGSGTNIAHGLQVANKGLANSGVTSNEYVVLLTDGVPNRTINNPNSSETDWGEIKEQADAIKDDVTALYVVGYAEANNDAKENLTSNVASTGCYYGATDSTQLSQAFEGIVDTISKAANAWRVTDPMGQYMEFVKFTGGKSAENHEAVCTPNCDHEFKDNTITWYLRKATAQGKYEKDNGTYTYTLSYQVRLNTSAAGFQAGVFYPTNKTTTLEYVTVDGNTTSDVKTAYFHIPTVKGRAVGQLTINKTMKGSTAPLVWSFTFNIYDNAEANGTPVETVTLDNTKTSDTVVLPVGTYYVKETAGGSTATGYSTTVTTGTGGDTVAPVAVDGPYPVNLTTTGVTLNFTNDYGDEVVSEKGSIKIEKVVTGTNAESHKTDTFTFQIYAQTGTNNGRPVYADDPTDTRQITVSSDGTVISGYDTVSGLEAGNYRKRQI